MCRMFVTAGMSRSGLTPACRCQSCLAQLREAVSASARNSGPMPEYHAAGQRIGKSLLFTQSRAAHRTFRRAARIVGRQRSRPVERTTTTEVDLAGTHERAQCLPLRSHRPASRAPAVSTIVTGTPVDVHDLRQQITCRPWHVGDDRPARAGERVEQPRLAGVGPARDAPRAAPRGSSGRVARSRSNAATRDATAAISPAAALRSTNDSPRPGNRARPRGEPSDRTARDRSRRCRAVSVPSS